MTPAERLIQHALAFADMAYHFTLEFDSTSVRVTVVEPSWAQVLRVEVANVDAAVAVLDTFVRNYKVVAS